MSYLGDIDEELTVVKGELSAIRKAQVEQVRMRRFATYAAVLGAVFAAGRLGILAVPFIKRSRTA